MVEVMGNAGLNAAQSGKRDEFYTWSVDIERELAFYPGAFVGRSVYVNCDDPRSSAFWSVFSSGFGSLGLGSLTATYFVGDGSRSYRYRMTSADQFHECPGVGPGHECAYEVSVLSGDGDFRSRECLEELSSCDVVVTNPPFSLFRDFLDVVVGSGKGFLILGNMNAVTCKSVFPLFQEGRVWYGPSISSGSRKFFVPDDYPLVSSGSGVDDRGRAFVPVKGVRWFTNLEHGVVRAPLVLDRVYEGFESEFPRYENLDAIEVGRTRDIPRDFEGLMGVPISFLDKYDPGQFEIIGLFKSGSFGKALGADRVPVFIDGKWSRVTEPVVDGKRKYPRIVIRHRR